MNLRTVISMFMFQCSGGISSKIVSSGLFIFSRVKNDGIMLFHSHMLRHLIVNLSLINQYLKKKIIVLTGNFYTVCSLMDLL